MRENFLYGVTAPPPTVVRCCQIKHGQQLYSACPFCDGTESSYSALLGLLYFL